MNTDCDIQFSGKIVGKAKIEKAGLYYHFRCTCQFPRDEIYRLVVKCGNENINLGICVPENGGYSLSARIPIKRFGADDVTVFALSKDNAMPKTEEKEISRLEELDAAFLLHGKVCIKNRVQDQPDSDQNPEYRNK